MRLQLRSIWKQLLCREADGIGGLQLMGQLEQLRTEVAGLQRCGHRSVAFLRRYTTAVLVLVRKYLPHAAWDQGCRGTTKLILLQLQLLHQHSAAARGAVEFTHVSKSGGSSLCYLASEANCTSQSFELSRNCMVAHFQVGRLLLLLLGWAPPCLKCAGCRLGVQLPPQTHICTDSICCSLLCRMTLCGGK